ncbi:MAG TPA: GntR family transcriptional regulator [Arthrobacter sp.]|nr:GntR family transcriptional regulator [Arthrobacter sp.]
MPLVEETAALLRERIFEGRYAPGARLPQAELSAELSLSRTPLREALRLLEEQGLVRTDDRGGARVATMSAEELLAALEFREAVEGLAARLACARFAAVRRGSSAAPPALAELRELAEAEARELLPGREKRFAQLSGRFHEGLLRASGNGFVQRQSGLIRLTEQLFRPAVLSTPEAAAAAQAAHGALVVALGLGNVDDAERLTRAWLRDAAALIRSNTISSKSSEPGAP